MSPSASWRRSSRARTPSASAAGPVTATRATSVSVRFTRVAITCAVASDTTRIDHQRKQDHDRQRPAIAQRLAQLLARDQHHLGELHRVGRLGRDQAQERLLQAGGVAGGRAQRRRRPLGEQPAPVEQADAIAEQLRLGQVVGGEQHRLAAIAFGAHEVAQEARREHVEPGGRLVEDQHVGIVQHRARDRRAAGARRWTATRSGGRRTGPAPAPRPARRCARPSRRGSCRAGARSSRAARVPIRRG